MSCLCQWLRASVIISYCFLLLFLIVKDTSTVLLRSEPTTYLEDYVMTDYTLYEMLGDSILPRRTIFPYTGKNLYNWMSIYYKSTKSWCKIIYILFLYRYSHKWKHKLGEAVRRRILLYTSPASLKEAQS